MRRTFWEQVRLNADCWEWTGATHRGYGKFGGKLAHRTAYVEIRSEIPEGLELDHLCRNTACVNPWHLEPVTRAVNARRKSEAQTHCKAGHEFTATNTLVTARQRRCRACQRLAVRRYKARLAVAS